MPLPQYCRPLAATGASREGSFVVRTNRHSCARFLLARLGIGEASCMIDRSKAVVIVRRALLAEFTHTLPSLPTPANGLPSRRVYRYVELAKLWLNFVPASRGDTISQVYFSHRGVDVNASSRCLRTPSGSRYTRERTHYHIVTTFKAKENGAPGVLA
jgi:hypothetical protein